MKTFCYQTFPTFVMLFLSFITSQAQNSAVLNLIPENVNLKEVSYYLASSDEALIPEAGKFIPKQKEITFGIDTSTLWVSVVVENLSSHSQKAVFSSDQFILEQVRFYHNTLPSRKIETSGWGMPVSKKKQPYTLHAFDFELKPHQTDTFYFSVKNKYQVLKLPLSIYSTEGFIMHTRQSLLLDGMVTMALLTAIFYCLYNLIFSGKDRKTLWSYLIYAVNFLLFFSIRISGPNFFTSQVDPLVNYYVNILIFISTYTFFRFGILFIDPEKRWLSKPILNAINVLFIITIIISLPPSWAHMRVLIFIKEIFFVFTIAYLVYYLVRAFRHSVIARVYFFLATPLILSGLMEGLTNTFGMFSLPASLFSSFRMAICIEMLYILIALIFRERALNRDIQNKLLQSELALLNAEIDTQEKERKRIAGDLHDDLGGTLSTLKRIILDKLSLITDAEAIQPIKSMMEKAAGDLRRITHDLMPPDFENMSLSSAVESLVSYNNYPARPAEFILSGKEKSLPKETEMQLYRIVSEAIQNINKHSEAQKIIVQLIYSTSDLVIMIEDNGKGFSIENQKNGLGLKNMEMRAQKSGGIITFDSNPNGTTIILEQPINEVADSDS